MAEETQELVVVMVDAIEAGEPMKAAELMKHHLLDLLSGLDLTRTQQKPESLADILC